MARKNAFEQYSDNFWERQFQANANARAIGRMLKRRDEEIRREEERGQILAYSKAKREEKRLAKEEKKRQKEEAKKADWDSVHGLLEKQRAEVESWEIDETDSDEVGMAKSEAYGDADDALNAIVEKAINPFSTLCLTGAGFTKRGLEVSAYISVNGSEGEEFFLMAKANPDGSAAINYAENDFTISPEELLMLFGEEEDARTEAGQISRDESDTAVPSPIKSQHEARGQYLFTIRSYLKKHGMLYDSIAVDKIRARARGEEFPLSEHIRAMVYAMLSNETEWVKIQPNLPLIDKIFHDYDPDYVKNADPETLVAEIRHLSCGNRNIKRQMEALRGNIETFEKLADGYGSMDECLNELGFDRAVEIFSDRESKYKLKMMAEALVSEYLRNVGMDGVKPDRHLCRFLGYDRMGSAGVSSSIASTDEVFAQVESLSKTTGLYKVEIDNIIWSFCAEGFGEVCTASPNCKICPVKDQCRYPGDGFH